MAVMERGVAGAAKSREQRGSVFPRCPVMDNHTSGGLTDQAAEAVAGEGPVAVAAEAGAGTPAGEVVAAAESGDSRVRAARAEQPQLGLNLAKAEISAAEAYRLPLRART